MPIGWRLETLLIRTFKIFDWVYNLYFREFEHNPEGEITEMIELLQDKGVSPEDTELIIRTTAKYPELFLDQMMYYELGFMPLEEDEKPIKKGTGLDFNSQLNN